MQTAAAVNDVRKSFGSVHAVRGVSLDVRPGEVHALLGRNGAGKSTVVKMIAGAIKPDSGTITIGGQALEPSPAGALERGVRCIYQQRTLVPNLSVAENVALLSRSRVWYSAARSRDLARERLARLGCRIDLDRIAGTLSVGEAQEVDIARALDDHCRLLILDEPTRSLSGTEVERLLEVMAQARLLGVGMLFISHELDVVQRVADRITVLRDGEVAIAGVPGGMSKQEIVSTMLGPAEAEEAAVKRDHRPPREVRSDGIRLHGIAGGRLEPLTLDLGAGEVTGITGSLGSGAEDLARILGGASKAQAGTIELNGAQVRFHSPRAAMKAGVTYVCDDRDGSGIFDNLLPVAQIGLSKMMISGRKVIRPAAEVAEALETANLVGLSDRDARRSVATLSGGNRQKVMIARCLATHPEVIVAHEPTIGVDIACRLAIHQLLRSLADEGATVIVVSSDTTEITEVAERALVMRAGRVVLDSREFDEGSLVGASLGASEADQPEPGTGSGEAIDDGT